ncbi:hypothetical protein V5E38_11000 [Rossellomorea sp. GAMAL-10_SWC]
MIFDILFFIIFIIGTFYCYRKFILNGSWLQFFIGGNSFVAGFRIIKDYIPHEKYWVYHTARITIGLSLIALASFLRKKYEKNIDTI